MTSPCSSNVTSHFGPPDLWETGEPISSYISFSHQRSADTWRLTRLRPAAVISHISHTGAKMRNHALLLLVIVCLVGCGANAPDVEGTEVGEVASALGAKAQVKQVALSTGITLNYLEQGSP